MADLAGTSVLHYRILQPLGSGGMGVVYEAEDTKLGRRVALKFLPPALEHDRPALERFQREARAASALNHPSICTIYAIEEADGRHFIAMERLDGESLDRRLGGRPLPWDAIVDLGTQIADALAAAHERGIVHRDIKPANIFITRDGRAKVLDFGVAKVASRSDAETVGPSTAAANLTGPGMAVGTIAYMSPEQARGEDLDARSDVFSLAAVLYEMATGQAAFSGKTSAVVFQKILDADPEPPRTVNGALPPRLEDAIVKGLEKDRELRYQSAAELRADLRRMRRDASAGRLAFTPSADGAAPAADRSSGAILLAEARRRKTLAGVATVGAVAILAAAAYGLYTFISGGPTEPLRSPAASLSVARLTTSGDVRGCVTISPDGKYVVYCDFSNRLKIYQVATGATVQIAAMDGATTTFSPDGNLVFLSAITRDYPAGVVFAVPVLGGEPRRVATNVGGPVGVSPDGRRIAFARFLEHTREIAIVVTDARGTGEEQTVVRGALDATAFADLGVSWSPDGKSLAAIQTTVEGGYRMRPVVIDIESGAVTPVGARQWTELGRVVWLPDGELLFSGPERLFGPYQFWLARLPSDEPVRLTQDVRGFGSFSVGVTSDGNTIATVGTDTVSNIWTVGPDGSGAPEQWTSGVQTDGTAGLAPQTDDRVFYGSFTGADVGIWRIDGPGRTPRRLTADYAEAASTPADGRFVAFQALHEGRFRIWRMDPDGGSPRAVSRGQDDIAPVASPDGRWIYYAAVDGARIVRIPAEGGAVEPITTESFTLLDLSPDGRRLLVRSQSEMSSHAVLDAETGAIQFRLTLPGASQGKWGRSSDVVAYIDERDGVANVWEQPIDGGPPRQLTTFPSGRIFNFRYDPPRKRLFLARGTRTGDVVLLRNFR